MATTIYKIGSRGDVVREIQKALNVYPDGIFGKVTEEAVREFQKEHGLKVDGIVGAMTLEKLGVAMTSQQTGLSGVATESQQTRLKKSVRRIDEIIVHCSATPEGKDYTVKDIRAWHTAPVSKGGRGWSDIAYHYVVYRDGSVHEGRDVNSVGTHCAGHNTYSIGVCYVGGMTKDMKRDKDTRTDAQKKGLLTLLRGLRRLYPKARIRGHRDFAAKACPSFDATKEYSQL